MNTQIEKKIIKNLKSLNSFQLSEVSDYVEFLRQRRKNKVFETSTIDVLWGKYKDRLSSSEQFAQKKREEIELEEEKWQSK